MRGSRESSVKFDSFPFLNVMVGMIAILLVFMFVILSTRSMQIAHDVMTITPAVRPQESGAGKKPADAPDASEGTGDLSEDDFQRLRKRLDQATSKLAVQKVDLEELIRRKQELEAQIQAKRDELALLHLNDEEEDREGLVLGQPLPVQIVQDANTKMLHKPRYVEVSAAGFTYHDGKGNQQAFPVSDLNSRTSEFSKFLVEVDRTRKKEYLLLLVHPNGAEVYRELRKHLRDNYPEQIREPINAFQVLVITKPRIVLGVEPFSRDWLFIPPETFQQ